MITMGGKVRVVEPYDVVPELAGKRAVVVGLEKRGDPPLSEPWVLVAFSAKDSLGLMLHDGRGTADRKVPEKYKGRCWYLPLCALLEVTA